ncbi:MAG: aminoglycoside phosphotransferase family protein [Cellulomonadaceae bacterium]
MADRPAAEVRITADLVRTLLAEQHPGLAGLPLGPRAEGWDNVVWPLGDALAVRLPRRAVAAPAATHEHRWLPGLALRLPVTVPEPVALGVPSAQYPWPWAVVRHVPGPIVAQVPRAVRSELAEPLAAFVAALHREGPDDGPRSAVRGVPLRQRAQAVGARLASGAVPHAPSLREIWSRALDAPEWSGAPQWLHGDLHPANMVAGPGPTLAGVIDFSDLTLGDPATDLATAWLTFDATGRTRFRAALAHRHPLDDPVWVRARGWALTMATALVVASDDVPAQRDLGLETVRELCTDALS